MAKSNNKSKTSIIDECSLPTDTPDVAIILGSGLNYIADAFERKIIFDYDTIPNLAQTTAPGHAGKVIIGYINETSVIAFQGRFHYYEGHTMEQVTALIRLIYETGCRKVIITNAAGGLNPDYKTGDLMIIRDHINLMPNPLVGPNDDRIGPRFPNMHQAYDPEYIAIAEEIAASKGIKVNKGVYAGLTGPSFETPAECNFLRTIGADAVGMSTVPEVIAARHAGMRVFGLSVIANKAGSADDDGDKVIKAVQNSSHNAISLITELIKRIC